ncbi:hypothetical protein COOONC_02024 [Cooperia oncophora]
MHRFPLDFTTVLRETSEIYHICPHSVIFNNNAEIFKVISILSWAAAKSPTAPTVDEPVTPPLTSCDQAPIRILCVTGNHCEIVNGRPQCVPDAVPIPRCAQVRVRCIAGHHCEDTPTGITCAPDPGRLSNVIDPAKFVLSMRSSIYAHRTVSGPVFLWDGGTTDSLLGNVPHINKTSTLNRVCLPPKCQCKNGFVREGGRCIDPNSCSNRRPIPTTTQNYGIRK